MESLKNVSAIRKLSAVQLESRRLKAFYKHQKLF